MQYVNGVVYQGKLFMEYIFKKTLISVRDIGHSMGDDFIIYQFYD